MEPTKAPLRVIFPLTKAPVVDRTATGFKIALGGSTTMTVACEMDRYDIRDGDLLSIYTEVLLKEKPNGQ